MDKEYLIKHNLMEAHNQFMRLSEGYLSSHVMKEDDDDENMQNQDTGNGDMMGQDMGNGEQQGLPDTGQESGEMPTGQDMGMPQDNQGMEGQGMPPQDQGMDMGSEMPGQDMLGDGGIDDGGMGDDTVIDVDDITNAQEKLNKKENEIGKDLGNVDDRITKLITAISKIQTSIDRNNNDIVSLKAELEKRVPTDTEKLNMQSLKMYPFNVSPNEYWKNKEKEGVYDAMGGDEKKQYDIRQKDIDDYSESEVEKSLDDELRQTMSDIFKDF